MKSINFSKYDFWFKKIPRGSTYLRPGNIFKSIVRAVKKKLGKKGNIESFENMFAQHFGVDSAIAFPYARTALYFLLKAYNFPSGSEVIVTSITISDIINAILLNNLKPVFIDFSHNTGNMDVNKIEECITDRTKSILITHLNGIPTEMDLILSIAKKHQLVVLEDASQGIGAKYKNNYVGLFGDAGFFSMSAQKPLCTFVGGIIVTNNKKLIQQLKVYVYKFSRRNFSFLALSTIKELIVYVFLSRYVFSFFSFYLIKIMNLISLGFLDQLQHLDFSKVVRRTKMPRKFLISFTEYQSRIGVEALKVLKGDTEKRSRLGYMLYSELEKNSVPGLIKIPVDSYCTFWRFPLWVKDPIKFRKYFFNRYIDTTVSGLDYCSQELAFKEFNKPTPEAYQFMNSMVFLPIHSNMDVKQIKYIAQVAGEYYQGY